MWTHTGGAATNERTKQRINQESKHALIPCYGFAARSLEGEDEVVVLFSLLLT
jgi:hypothetical protein